MRDQLTRSDVKKIEEEIEYRKLVVRKEAIEAVKEARAHGDLSENFEYHAAKKDKNKNESRIRYLERMIIKVTLFILEPSFWLKVMYCTPLEGIFVSFRFASFSTVSYLVSGTE